MTPEQIPGFRRIVPIQLVSEANVRCHWTARYKRSVAQKQQVRASLLTLGMSPKERRIVFHDGAKITLHRTGAKLMDGDNLQRAFKACRDAIADFLMHDDGSDLLTWEYSQSIGRPASVTITIEAI